MTREDKELLFKDLCARFPYGVKVSNEIRGGFEVYGFCESYIFAGTETSHADFRIEKIKPYLRPMSGMTEEEKLMYEGLMIGTDNISYILDVIDWLNAHHFDYRGLIEKGLAIDATGLNIY